MKINTSSNYFIAVTILLSLIGIYHGYRRDKDYNLYKCKTKQLEIKGIIDKVNTRANYMTAHIKGGTFFFSLNIEQTKFIKGFEKKYSYNIGDSIIKKANSKEFIIKRGNNIAVHILDCDD